MARRNSKSEDTPADEPTTEATETNDDPTEPGNEPEATESTSTETKTELTDEQIAEAVKPFLEVIATAVAERDESTGSIPDAQVDAVNAAYSALDGAKIKNAGKRELNELMKNAMNEMDIVLARGYMELNEKLQASGAKKATKTREPKAPIDPTEAYVERVAVLNLAYNLATEVSTVPEGVAEDYQDRVAVAISEVDQDQIQAYREWLNSDAEDKGDAPEVPTLISAAVKLSVGKSAKPGKAAKRPSGEGNGQTYDGPRRNIAKHITEAFAQHAPGTFLKVAEIRKYESTEYGKDSPSAGAINARLFPKSGKCSLVGVEPGTNETGEKGGRKA